MPVVDVSPRWDNATITIDRNHQSVSGKALCVAMSTDGQRLYLGGHSAVWRSDDGGLTWTHPERPPPPPGSFEVPGALLVPNVYDLLISPRDPDVVLAATGRDCRSVPGNGIWRSIDGARSWTLVHQFRDVSGRAGTVGGFAVAPDDPDLMFAGGQFGAARSTDAGFSWSPVLGPSFLVHYVVVGPVSGSTRHVYAAGNRVWRSVDGGQTWDEDAFRPALGSPSDGVGDCARSLALHPDDANVVYLAFGTAPDEEERPREELWRGVFPAGAGDATWIRLAPPSIDHPGVTASGTTYVLLHRDPEGRIYHLFSDRRTVHASIGVPDSPDDWIRLDPDPVHVDPHGIAVTPDFRWARAGTARGRIAMVNDGGVVVSDDGAASWTPGDGLATLGLVNAAVNPRSGGGPALTIQTGDNNGFFSPDGGRTWRTQDYRGGDNDASFADPAQPNRLIVFAPRDRPRKVYLYVVAPGQVPNGGSGTDQRQKIPGPPPVDVTDNEKDDPDSLWNCTSAAVNQGYRPLVLTLDGETPRPDGDFVTIIYDADRFDSPRPTFARLMRSTALSTVTATSHWVTSATAEGPGVRAFQQGPDLPDPAINVVQASGGHADPTFYVGDPAENAQQRVWKWRAGMTAWEQIVPGTNRSAPTVARRFFVDPYRPSVIYVLGRDHVHLSTNGGRSWRIEAEVEAALTQGGAFPVDLTREASSEQALLRDMLFHPKSSAWRVAIGPAGVFQTRNARTWDHLLHSAAAGMRPNNAVLDWISRPGAHDLYVATSNRGVLRIEARPLRETFAVRAIAHDCLGLDPPLSIRDDIFEEGGSHVSLFDRLRDIRESCP